MDQQPYQVGERRPLASRDTGWARAASAWLAARGANANAISIAGMLAALACGAAFAATAHVDSLPARALFLLGALLTQCRLLANLLDGMVAVASGKASRLGELYNEVPDRISDAAILIGLGYSFGGDVALGYLAALAAVFTAYVRAQGAVVGATQDFRGPMAKPQRMFVVTVAALAVALAPAAWQPAWLGRGIAAAALAIIFVGSLVTALRRLLRIAAALQSRT